MRCRKANSVLFRRNSMQNSAVADVRTFLQNYGVRNTRVTDVAYHAYRQLSAQAIDTVVAQTFE